MMKIYKLEELLHLTYNEDGDYILSWKRPDFQVEKEDYSAKISIDDFARIGKLLQKAYEVKKIKINKT